MKRFYMSQQGTWFHFLWAFLRLPGQDPPRICLLASPNRVKHQRALHPSAPFQKCSNWVVLSQLLLSIGIFLKARLLHQPGKNPKNKNQGRKKPRSRWSKSCLFADSLSFFFQLILTLKHKLIWCPLFSLEQLKNNLLNCQTLWVMEKIGYAWILQAHTTLC